jgi:hypothetical protein
MHWYPTVRHLAISLETSSLELERYSGDRLVRHVPLFSPTLGPWNRTDDLMMTTVFAYKDRTLIIQTIPAFQVIEQRNIYPKRQRRPSTAMP